MTRIEPPQSNSLIEIAELEKLRALETPSDPDFLLELIAIFHQGVEERLKKIVTALTTGDFQRIRSDAHNLKSTSASVGARRMSELCRALENAAGQAAEKVAENEPHDEILTELRRLTSELQVHYPEVKRELSLRLFPS